MEPELLLSLVELRGDNAASIEAVARDIEREMELARAIENQEWGELEEPDVYRRLFRDRRAKYYMRYIEAANAIRAEWAFKFLLDYRSLVPGMPWLSNREWSPQRNQWRNRGGTPEWDRVFWVTLRWRDSNKPVMGMTARVTPTETTQMYIARMLGGMSHPKEDFLGAGSVSMALAFHSLCASTLQHDHVPTLERVRINPTDYMRRFLTEQQTEVEVDVERQPPWVFIDLSPRFLSLWQRHYLLQVQAGARLIGNGEGDEEDPRMVAALLLSRRLRQLTEEQRNELIFYLVGEVPGFEDLEEEQEEALGDRDVAILILEHALGIQRADKAQTPPVNYPQILAQRWLARAEQRQETRKRTRVEVDKQSTRAARRAALFLNPERLAGCAIFALPTLLGRRMRIVRDVSLPADSFGVRLPLPDFQAILEHETEKPGAAKLIELVNPQGNYRLYARPIDTVEDDSALYVSAAVFAQLHGPANVYVNACVPRSRTISQLTFTLYAEEPKAPPQLLDELQHLLSGVPALALGMELATPTAGTVLVTQILGADREPVFVAALHESGEVDVPLAPFEFGQKIQCSACGRSAPPRSCGGCRVAFYCDSACQRSHWRSGAHARVCRLFV